MLANVLYQLTNRSLLFTVVISDSVATSDQLWMYRLLKLAAQFYPRQSTSCPPADGTELRKQCSYVRCIIQLVCRCSRERDPKLNALSLVVNNLITETESVAATSELNWFGYLSSSSSSSVLLSSSKVLLLEDPWGPIFKSLSLSSSLEVQVLENFRGLSRLSVSALCAGVAMT